MSQSADFPAILGAVRFGLIVGLLMACVNAGLYAGLGAPPEVRFQHWLGWVGLLGPKASLVASVGVFLLVPALLAGKWIAHRRSRDPSAGVARTLAAVLILWNGAGALAFVADVGAHEAGKRLTRIYASVAK